MVDLLGGAQPIRLEGAVEPFAGSVFCHAPAAAPFRISALASLDDGADRWGGPGRRTTYLAGDPGVALAELARHLDGQTREERQIVHLRLSGVTVLDLRRRVVRAGLGLVDWPNAAADLAAARRIADAIRSLDICQGLIAPSVAFLDQPERFNVVLFGETLRGGLDGVLGEPLEVGRLVLRLG